MLYYMDSKVFNKYFLNNESDKDILDCQYVLVSYRIRSGNSRENICVYNALYPESSVLVADNTDLFKELYYKQLKAFRNNLAILIKGSIKNRYNIIFMCSKNENKIGYLKVLSDYVYDTFGYPMYDYKDYIKCRCDIIDFNKDKVLKKCNKFIKKDKYNHLSDDDLIHMIKNHPDKLEKILIDKYNYDISIESDYMDDEEIFELVQHIRHFFR